jgi:glycylpeptide N-tetradecanoyltransferase
MKYMHTYWDKQPVPKVDTKPGEIEERGVVSKKMLTLPDGFIWSSCSIEEAQSFLKEHYIGNNTFRLAYTHDTLRWIVDDSVAIRKDDTEELVGYISSTPVNVRVEDDVKKMVEINLLCVHGSFRSMGLAPILISEMKRRANRKDIWQAVYTAHTHIPTPIVKSAYWHRLLDVKGLVKAGFHQTNRLRDKFLDVRGPCKFQWRKMNQGDVPKVSRILREYTKNYKIAPVIDEAYVRRWVLPIHSYVDDTSDNFISFYDIPYDRVDKTDTVRQAYRFYLVGDVYNDAFILCKNLGFDVFNTLDVGVDTKHLEKMKFLKGNGYVHYYLFNWCLSGSVQSEDIQLILP